MVSAGINSPTACSEGGSRVAGDRPRPHAKRRRGHGGLRNVEGNLKVYQAALVFASLTDQLTPCFRVCGRQLPDNLSFGVDSIHAKPSGLPFQPPLSVAIENPGGLARRSGTSGPSYSPQDCCRLGATPDRG